MPKPYTFPILFDEVIQLSILNLKQLGYLANNQIINDTLIWSKNGQETASISILVDTYSEQPYISLNYKYKGEPRNYEIDLIKIPSNLGKGIIWNFLCPQTKRNCRKLYSIEGYFLHREAFHGCLYKSQTRSKLYRYLERTFGLYFKSERLCQQLIQKNTKRIYGGVPTKRIFKIRKLIQQVDSIPFCQVAQNVIAKSIKGNI